MELVKKGIDLVRKSLLFNALSSISLALVLVAFFLSYWYGTVLTMVMGVLITWFLFVVSTIIAIVYQYRGAIDLIRASRAGYIPHRKLLLVAAILILIDPLFNVFSGAGMLMIPRRFISGKWLNYWWSALPLFFTGALGTLVQLLFPFPDIDAPISSIIPYLLVSIFLFVLTSISFILMWKSYGGIRIENTL